MHAVSACLWFRKEAILISCTYCNALYSLCYLSLSHDHLLHTITSLCTVAAANRTILFLSCRLQTCRTNYPSCSPTCRQQSSSGSRIGQAILRRAPSLILSRNVLWQPCCSKWSRNSLHFRSTNYTSTGANGEETYLGLTTMTMWTCCSICMLVTWLRDRRARVRVWAT